MIGIHGLSTRLQQFNSIEIQSFAIVIISCSSAETKSGYWCISAFL